jgi:hypothetical protein
MGIFGNSKPSVSKSEFQEKVLMFLYNRGWSVQDRDKVKAVFAGHLHETGSGLGIDREEIEHGLRTLKDIYKFSPEKINQLREVLYRHA